jgi:two-component system sensor histidine kinase BaeS
MKINLRLRLLAGHILPVFLLIPLVGLALIYLIETRVFIPALASELIDQGLLIGRLAENTPQVWLNPNYAQAFLMSLPFQRPTSVDLLSTTNEVLATSRTNNYAAIGTVLTNLPAKGPGASPYWGIATDPTSKGQVLNVIITVETQDGQAIGLLRIYRQLTDIESGLAEMRVLILLVLLAGLLISGAIAFLLSESVSRPLKELAAAISAAPVEGEVAPLYEGGFEEVEAITHAFNRLQERRQELEKTRQQMVANVVHEIGRPLGSLRIAVHALESGASEDPQLRDNMLKGMTERIRRLGRLLEDLSLAYRGMARTELNLKQVDLASWLEQLTPLWVQTAKDKMVDWQMDIQEDLPKITTDPDRLSQAFSNLVDNALKFTPPGGKVSLNVKADSTSVQLQVSDTGPGIALEDQPHLFTPFFRSITPGWKAPGLGLGLSIARSIVESLGGQIDLLSQPGQGSTFTIKIPIN